MEFVFVAPREALFTSCTPQGFLPFRTEADADRFLECIAREGFFVERERAERTPAWKQVIPYCVLLCADRVLLMKRRAKGGEARLHDKLTIGVGGHINPVDMDEPSALGSRDLVRTAARREIAEELEVRGEYELRLSGYLNDDSNPVGAVHVGLVFTAITAAPVRIREEDVLEGHLVALEELRATRACGANLETWSALLIDHLDTLASTSTSSLTPASSVS